MASTKRIWPWLVAVVVIASAAGLYRYFFMPYEPGPWHQVWTVTVTEGAHTGTSTGFGIGRCGDEGANGASSAKQGALGRACFAARLCPGDSVCDCAASARVEARCEAGQTPGRTRLGDRLTVPVR